MRSAPQIFVAIANFCAARRRRGRVNDAPTVRRSLHRSGTRAPDIYQFKTTVRIASAW
jgi:hypothetical protein